MTSLRRKPSATARQSFLTFMCIESMWHTIIRLKENFKESSYIILPRQTVQKIIGKSYDPFLSFLSFFFNLHSRTCLLILERGEGREKERERNISVMGETSISCLSYAPDPGWSPGQGSNLRPCFMGWWSNQLSHTGQSQPPFPLKALEK